MGKLGSLTLGRKLVAVIVAFIIDIAATVLAALAAYTVVIAFTTRGTAVSLFAMQFLTAFGDLPDTAMRNRMAKHIQSL